MAEHDRLARAPILVKDFRAIGRGNRAHALPPLVRALDAEMCAMETNWLLQRASPRRTRPMGMPDQAMSNVGWSRPPVAPPCLAAFFRHLGCSRLRRDGMCSHAMKRPSGQKAGGTRCAAAERKRGYADA